MTKPVAQPLAAVGVFLNTAPPVGVLTALQKNALFITKPIAPPRVRHGAYHQAVPLPAVGVPVVALIPPLLKLTLKLLALIPAINGV
jgi:hypothetical protein